MSNKIPIIKNVEDKVNFRYVKLSFEQNIIDNRSGLNLKDNKQYVDDSNLPREQDRFLLTLLDYLGIDYEISFRMPTHGPSFIGRRASTRLKMRIPPHWSGEYQAISRRIAEFEAKQHI